VFPDQLQPTESSGQSLPRALGKNLNGYFGETIDVSAVLRDCFAAAQANGWQVEDIVVNEILSIPALVRPGAVVPAGTGQTAASATRVYISAGIHGDEPAGPLAMLQLLRENRWPSGMSFWLCPCLNPNGFLHNRRENPDGADLNRQYLNPKATETSAHIAWLERQSAFDLCLCLHEDWESHGFYLYELNPDNQPSLGPEILRRVALVCPIDLSPSIEGRPAEEGIIRPTVDPRDRPQWPESFYLLTYKTRLSYTLEAPSDFALAARMAALVVGVNSALAQLQRRSADLLRAG
jgi:succinylglutamate desuccinylase/aspartoacylase family protein